MISFNKQKKYSTKNSSNYDINNNILSSNNKNIFNKTQELYAYQEMLLIRRFEEKASQLYGMGLIGGFCHLYIGQEAVIIGIQMAKENEDQIITAYRDHGHALAMGIDPNNIMAELTGRKDGISKGKGGSMHIFNKNMHFYGGHGIVGAQISLGTGIAFSNKYKKNQLVSITFLGDGATNQGQFYESLNMAKLWKLPIVYVIENNKYGMGTSIERSSAIKKLSNSGLAFDIPGKQVNGMDVQQVMYESKIALDFCRKGNGPYIIEMITYRYRGHSMSDPAQYRPKNELQKIKNEQDPINQVYNRIINKNLATEVELKTIDQNIRKKINHSVEFAKSCNEPDESELYKDIII